MAALTKLVPVASAERLFHVADAMRVGMSDATLYELTRIDPWFLAQSRRIVDAEKTLSRAATSTDILRDAKRLGFSDRQIARVVGTDEDAIRAARLAAGIRPVYARVDTCAAEFVAHTPYLYSTYESESESKPTSARKVLILGGGPNRIGQGIEFDYCCVHAVQALRELGFETIMVNCNPETVSTDYDTADRLYFEPLTLEDVLGICDEEKPEGVIVQFGGQTPLKLAVPLEKRGIKLLGTTADAIDRAENRERFGELLKEAGLSCPEWGIARRVEEAPAVANRLGYPVVVRPSYVLGGRAMEVVYDDAQLQRYLVRPEIEGAVGPGHPLLLDHFLRDAIEVDADAVSDGTEVVVCGVMEHIEEAGIHSGDSACALPP